VNAETKKAICLSVPKSPTQKLTGKKYEPPVEKYLDEGLQTDRVYFGFDKDTGELTYIGKTIDIPTRQAQHDIEGIKNIRIEDIDKSLPNLTPHQARAIEQYYIANKGLTSLENKINSIAIAREIYPGTQQFARDFIEKYSLPLDLK
jgi:hypothetical protein